MRRPLGNLQRTADASSVDEKTYLHRRHKQMENIIIICGVKPTGLPVG